ncbi:unnamed protein product [Aphanomyces euteiches]
MLAGCTKAPQTDVKETAAGQKTKISVWIWEDAKKIIEPNMKAFNQAYPNIDVDLHVLAQSDVYKNYLITASSGDSVPDVITLETLRLSEMINSNSLLDVTDKVQPYKDKINTFKWADATKDGKVYAMPWDSGPVVMFYRNDLFAKAGLPTDPKEVAAQVKTWDDYKRFAKILKDKTGTYMMADSGIKSDAKFFEQMIWQRDQWYFDKSGKPQLDKPEIIESAKYFVDMVKDGYVYDVEPWSDSWYNVFKKNKVATIVGASWYDGLLASDIDPDAKGKWSAAPMPKWSESDPYSSANDGGANLAINKNSKHPEEAWKFIEFMLGQNGPQLNMLKDFGLFPSLETTYDDEAFKMPVPYFNNQPVRQMYVDAVKQITPIVYTKNYSIANQIVRNAFAEIFLDKKSEEEVFKKAAKELQNKIK